MLKECKEFCKDWKSNWKLNAFAIFSVIVCAIIGLILRFIPERWIQLLIDKLFGRKKSRI
jgi:hypothetical protein